jgi:hypothetical protein
VSKGQQLSEGTVFTVPLEPGYAVGVIGRLDLPIAFGFFFGPLHRVLPALDDVLPLRPVDAVLRTMFGIASLRRDDWPILGQLPDWDREAWRVPLLVRFDELRNEFIGVRYEDDLAQPVEEVPLTATEDELREMPSDDLVGDQLLPKQLQRLSEFRLS